MTNGEKYKNEDERRRAFDLYCSNSPESICKKHNYICKYCMISWLELEAEEEK